MRAIGTLYAFILHRATRALGVARMCALDHATTR